MPTYDYICNSCNHELEIFQSIVSSPKRKCPECGRNTLKRQIGAGAGVIFKGSGFYETDYRSPEYKKREKEDKEASKKSESSDGSSKDSKTSDSGKAKKSKATKSDKKSSDG